MVLFAISSFVFKKMEFMGIQDMTEDHFIGIKALFFSSSAIFISSCARS